MAAAEELLWEPAELQRLVSTRRPLKQQLSGFSHAFLLNIYLFFWAEHPDRARYVPWRRTRAAEELSAERAAAEAVEQERPDQSPATGTTKQSVV